MYYEPCARFRIGTDSRYLEFTSVNKIEIEKSVKELGDKATITIPRNYEKLNGKSILEIIKPGDKTRIWLGYDGKYHEEFSGYIREVESDVPLVLHVDDEFYPLKRNNLMKTFADGTKLETILKFIAPGYTIQCADVALSAFNIPNVSTFKVLTAIKDQYGFYTKLNGKVLTCMWPYDIGGLSNIHTYTFYTSTVKKSSLKYVRAEDVKIRIRAIANQRNGKKLKYETGNKEDDSSLRTLNFGAITQAQLEEFAEKEYQRLCFDGYTGSITGFGNPRTQPGDTLKIIDPQEPDREGNFLIDSVKISYDLSSGFERENQLSFKV